MTNARPALCWPRLDSLTLIGSSLLLSTGYQLGTVVSASSQATTHCTLALLPHIILGGWLIFANFPRFLSKLTRKHNLRHL